MLVGVGAYSKGELESECVCGHPTQESWELELCPHLSRVFRRLKSNVATWGALTHRTEMCVQKLPSTSQREELSEEINAADISTLDFWTRSWEKTNLDVLALCVGLAHPCSALVCLSFTRSRAIFGYHCI